MKRALKAALRPACRFAQRALNDTPAPPVPAAPYDPFLVWLRFINPGMLTQGNIDLLSYCVENLRTDAPVVEIGSFAGLSLNHIIQFLRRSNRRNPVFSVDRWWFEGSRDGGMIENSHVSFDAYRKHATDMFRQNVQLFSGDRLPHHIELSSDAFFFGLGSTRNS
jgi:hypothetical protein